jgi:uncharacterized protein (UPF0261 family)
MPKTVLIISTLNTKREETLYLKEQVEALELKALLMDISMRGDGAPEADILPDRVAKAGGSRFEDIRQSKDRAPPPSPNSCKRTAKSMGLPAWAAPPAP